MPVKLENGGLKGLTLEIESLLFANTRYQLPSEIHYLLSIYVWKIFQPKHICLFIAC